MPRRVLRIRRQQRLTHLDLVGQIQSPAVADHPHGTADRRQGGDDPLQESGIILFRPKITLGQLSDLAYQSAYLLLGLLDGVSIDCLVAGHFPTPFDLKWRSPTTLS